jgi:hypothetical protein
MDKIFYISTKLSKFLDIILQEYLNCSIFKVNVSTYWFFFPSNKIEQFKFLFNG